MKVTKAVIPAAGLGTRFLPITKAVPKPMLSVLDKPTIQYIAEELKSVGIDDIIIVVNAESDVIIRKHFGSAYELEQRLLADGKKDLYKIERETQKYHIHYAVQTEANGLAGALLCASHYIGDEPFALLLGDELIYNDNPDTSCMKKLISIFEKNNKSVLATMEVFGDEVKKYGNIGIKKEIDGVMEVNKIVEKPSINEALSNYAIIGRYVLSGEIMHMLRKLEPRNNEIYLTDALDVLAKNGKLLATTFEGTRYDVGDKFGYIKANVEYALRSPEIGEDTKGYIKELAEKF